MLRLREWATWLWQPLQLLVLAQLAYLLIGINYLEFHVSWVDVLASVAAAVAVEYAGMYAESRTKGRRFAWHIPSSALAAALGVGIFFRATSPWLFALASALAIASKYLIRKRGAHIFNPSNFGIVALVLLLPGAATIEFTQWGSSPYIYAAVAAISLYIAYRAGVILTTLSFLASYTLMLVLSISIAPHLFSLHHYGLIGPSFILFASFMITDPKTAPRGFWARIAHGICITLLYFFLESMGVRYGLFIASFSVALLNALLPPLAARLASPLPATLQNGATLAMGLLLCLCSYATLGTRYPVAVAATLPSPQFLLFGVESTGMRACMAPQLSRTVPQGLERSPSAYGAAWGDYDLDGYDDLFVSNISTSSRLYRNKGDGTFADATEEAGVAFHRASAAFFADYDNDGDVDLFVLAVPDRVASSALHTRSPDRIDTAKGVRVYRNIGGSFREETERAGLGSYRAPAGLMTATFGDYDSNGTLDLVLVEFGTRRALSFDRASEAHRKAVFDPYLKKTSSVVCGALAREVMDAQPAIAEAVAYALGGRTMEELRACLVLTTAISRGAGDAPERWTPRTPVLDALVMVPGGAHLYLNDGSGFREHASFSAFVDATVAEGRREMAPSGEAADSFFQNEGLHPYDRVTGAFFQAVSFDYDGDGRLDILLASDFGASLLLRNDGALRFSNATAAAGLDYYGTGMGVAVGDYDRDARPDLLITNSLADGLFRNKGDGTFERLGERAPISEVGVGWGAAFVDYDLDGYDDLYVANGDNMRLGAAPDPNLQRALFRQDSLYRNKGDGTFEDRTGIDLCGESATAYPMAVSDYDNDGDPDMFVGNIPLHQEEAQQNFLLKNTLPAGPSYLAVRLRGSRSNAQGVGAVVSVSYGGATSTKYMAVGESFVSQHGSSLLFGLGAHEGRADITVRWPSGGVSVLRNVEVNRQVTVEE